MEESLVRAVGWPAFGSLPPHFPAGEFVMEDWREPRQPAEPLFTWKDVRESVVDSYKKAKAYVFAPERILKASVALTVANSVAAIYNIHHGNAHHCHAQVALGVSNAGGAVKAVAIGTIAAVSAYREAHPPFITLGLSQRSAAHPSAQHG